MTPRYDVVVPTAGRPSLTRCLEGLAAGDGPLPERVVVVDDRRLGGLLARVPETLRDRTLIVAGRAAGPAAARNAGWRACRSDWVAFLDDDVVPPPGWRAALARDLAAAAGDVGGVQGRIRVPLPEDRRPTDAERNVAGLETARWATADLAYRRAALLEVGGFDERFPRAYREDADLGLRVEASGWRIITGERWIEHPVGTAPWHASLSRQRGNADDVLMERLHGPDWRERAGAPAGRRRAHLTTAAAGLLALATRRRLPALAWAAGTLDLLRIRVAPGPRTPPEMAAMTATSIAMPFAAAFWWLAGQRLNKGTVPFFNRPAAVLFDRDDTLIADVPYNGDPDRVEPVPGAVEAVERVRAAGLPVGVVSNQSGVARGLLEPAQVEAVNARTAELLGPFDTWQWCPHGPEDACACRKPAPGLVQRAAADLGVEPGDCVVIGDIGADVEAAASAGAAGILVPTHRTRPEEVAAAAQVAPDIDAAVDIAIGAPA